VRAGYVGLQPLAHTVAGRARAASLVELWGSYGAAVGQLWGSYGAAMGEHAGSPLTLHRPHPRHGLTCSLTHSLTYRTRYVLRDKESTVRVDLAQLRHDHYSATAHPLGHYPHPMPHPGSPGGGGGTQAEGPLGGASMGGLPLAVAVGPMGHAATPMARPRPASEAGDWVSCGNWAGDGAVPRCAGGPRCAGADLNPSRLSTLRAPSSPPSFRAISKHALARVGKHGGAAGEALLVVDLLTNACKR